MESNAIRVFLVDDHVALTRAYAFVFAHDPGLRVVASAASLAEARRLLADGLGVDVALVDLELPDGSGLDLIPAVCAANRGAYAIVLSGELSSRARALAVAAGASGVLDKATADPAAIAAAIRAVARGEQLIPAAEMVGLLGDAAQWRRQEAAARAALAELTPREREVLRAIAEGLSDKAIADRLSLSDRTVRNHVAAILAKLGVDSRLQALLLAARLGAVRLA